MRDNLQVRRAATNDLPVILGMIDEAADWLRSKDTDQWSSPWPNEQIRDERVLRGLHCGSTWIAEKERSRRRYCDPIHRGAMRITRLHTIPVGSSYETAVAPAAQLRASRRAGA